LRGGLATLRREGMSKDRKEKFVFPFEKLEVWQLAVDLADFVLELMETFPNNHFLRC